MILDGYLLFTGTSNGNSSAPASGSATDAPTTGTQQSANIVDLGVTSGIPSSANGGGARDIAIGNDVLWLLIQCTTAFTGGTSLQVQLEGAPDNGSGAPGSWTVMWDSTAILETDLFVGSYISNVAVPRTVPGQALPRFLRLNYITVGTHTGGAIEGTVALDRFDQITGTGGALSGYPAGINVAN